MSGEAAGDFADWMTRLAAAEGDDAEIETRDADGTCVGAAGA